MKLYRVLLGTTAVTAAAAGAYVAYRAAATLRDCESVAVSTQDQEADGYVVHPVSTALGEIIVKVPVLETINHAYVQFPAGITAIVTVVAELDECLQQVTYLGRAKRSMMKIDPIDSQNEVRVFVNNGNLGTPETDPAFVEYGTPAVLGGLQQAFNAYHDKCAQARRVAALRGQVG